MNIYLDHASTTKPKSEVVAAVMKGLTETWGNPSSLHTLGQDAKAIVDDARQAVADLIGAKPSEIIFTSGACEANSLAICGLLKQGDYTLITTNIEHKSIMNIADDYYIKSQIYVDKNGFTYTIPKNIQKDATSKKLYEDRHCVGGYFCTVATTCYEKEEKDENV